MTGPLHTQWLRAQRWLARHSHHRWLPLPPGPGVVSFSFDDAPHTACTTGRALLEAQGCHGTWYVAGGLTGQTEEGRPCHSLADLQALQAAGHQLACHTWDHLRCEGQSTAALHAQWERNARFLAELGVPPGQQHFSFPFGAYDLRAKREAARRFVTSRLTGGGVQVGRVDLNALRSQALYSDHIDAASVHALIQQTRDQGGWLIFYTHDVDDTPSRWGCTPARLQQAISTARDLGCRVLSVQEALDYFQQASAP